MGLGNTATAAAWRATLLGFQNTITVNGGNLNTMSSAIGSLNSITDAGMSNAIGYKNTITASSQSNLQSNAIGSGNQIVDVQFANALGTNNVVTGALGTAVGAANVVAGTGTTAVGYMNGVGSTGVDNFYAGVQSGTNITGNNNVAIGNGALSTASTTSLSNAVAIGNKAQVNANGDVAIGSGSKTSATVAVTSTTIAGNTYNFAGGNPTGAFSVGGPSGTRQVQNVAAGQLTATSTDAVNGSQLYATNQALDTLASTITTGDPNSVKYDDGTKTSVTMGGPTSTDGGVTGGTTITNVHQGAVTATSTDAVNGAQLYATNQNVTNLGDQVTTIGGDLTNLTTSVTNGTIGPVQVTGNANQLALVAPGGTGSSPGAAQNLTNVANGAVNSTSADAVNGSQLYGVANSVANNFGGGSTVNPTTGEVTAPTYVVGGNTYNNVGDAITNIDAGMTSLTTNVISLTTNVTDLQQDALQWNSVLNGGTGAYDASHGSGAPQKITNLANGDVSATSTDAVNGSQLYSVVAASAANAVQYDDGTKTSVTLGGPASTDGGVTGGTTITNVHQGALSATSTDAVNGAQLYATNQNVANLGDQVTTIGGDLTNLTTSVTNGTIGPVQVTGNVNQLALVAPGSTGSSPGAAQNLTNVANGAVNATSTDAVNGSQLYATQQEISSLAGNAVQYDDSTKTSVTMGGPTSTDGGVTGGTTITNVSQGALSSTSTDAVNGAQLYATNQNVTNLGNQVTNLSQDVTNLGTTVNNISQDVTNLNNGTAGIVRQVGGAPGSGDITVGAETGGTVVNVSGTDGDRTVTGVAAGTLSSTSTDAVNGSQLYSTGNSVATILGGGATYNSTTGEVTNPSYVINGNTYNNVGDALQAAASSGTDDLAVHYVADANGNPTNQVALTGDGSGAAVSITNVAAGSVAAGSTDAVNGGQLHDLGQSLADGMGGNSTYNSSTGTVTTSLNYGGNTYNSVQGALTNIDNSINGGAGIKYFHTNSTEADSSATGDNSTAIGPLAVATATDSIAIGNGAVASNAGSVALGAGSTTDAVHDGQKGFGSATVAGSSATSSVSVGSSGKERQIQNVAAGVVSSTSTDAVNGSQLNSVIGGVNNVGTSTASALGGGSQYDPTTGLISAPSYTVQGNTYNNAGDAFSAIDGALSHQGAQLNWLTKYANSNFKRLDGAIAGMTALATLEFDPTPGKFSVAGGWGFYESQHAFAGGVAYTFNDRLQVNGRGWYSPSSRTGGGGIGVRYSFP